MTRNRYNTRIRIQVNRWSRRAETITLIGIWLIMALAMLGCAAFLLINVGWSEMSAFDRWFVLPVMIGMVGLCTWSAWWAWGE